LDATTLTASNVLIMQLLWFVLQHMITALNKHMLRIWHGIYYKEDKSNGNQENSKHALKHYDQ